MKLASIQKIYLNYTTKFKKSFDTKDSLFKGKSIGTGWQILSTTAVTLGVRSVTSNYTIVATDDVILASGATTLYLPSALANTGKVFEIKKTDSSNIVTIQRTTSDTIDGATDNSGSPNTFVTLNSQNETIKFISDGA